MELKDLTEGEYVTMVGRTRSRVEVLKVRTDGLVDVLTRGGSEMTVPPELLTKERSRSRGRVSQPAPANGKVWAYGGSDRVAKQVMTMAPQVPVSPPKPTKE